MPEYTTIRVLKQDADRLRLNRKVEDRSVSDTLARVIKYYEGRVLNE